MASSDGRGDLPASYRFEEIERRLDHLLRIGKVAETDYAAKSAPKVRVLIDGELSNWIRIAAIRQGPDRHWWVPEIDEQVLIWAPTGNTTAAFVFGSVARDLFPSPDKNENQHYIDYLDETWRQYDRELHQSDLNIPHDGDAHDRVMVTEDSEIYQRADLIRLRIKDTFIEITDGKILMSVNGDTTMSLEEQKLTVDAELSHFTGDVEIDGDLLTKGDITSMGGIGTVGNIAVAGEINAVGAISSATIVTAAKVVEAGGSLSLLIAEEVRKQLMKQNVDAGDFEDAILEQLSLDLDGLLF